MELVRKISPRRTLSKRQSRVERYTGLSVRLDGNSYAHRLRRGTLLDEQLHAAGLEDHQDPGHERHLGTNVRYYCSRVCGVVDIRRHEVRMADHHHQRRLPDTLGVHFHDDGPPAHEEGCGSRHFRPWRQFLTSGFRANPWDGLTASGKGAGWCGQSDTEASCLKNV